MKSKLATIGTLVALAGGTTGAIALGSNNTGNGFRASAASSQYCPPQDYGAAYSAGYNDGFDAGYSRGFSAGFGAGYSAGFSAGYSFASGPSTDLR